MKTTIEKLLDCSNRDIVVFKDCDDNYCVQFDHADVFDGLADRTVVGRGKTIEAAAKDYITKISGKKLRFNSSEDLVTFIIFNEE